MQELVRISVRQLTRITSSLGFLPRIGSVFGQRRWRWQAGPAQQAPPTPPRSGGPQPSPQSFRQRFETAVQPGRLLPAFGHANASASFASGSGSCSCGRRSRQPSPPSRVLSAQPSGAQTPLPGRNEFPVVGQLAAHQSQWQRQILGLYFTIAGRSRNESSQKVQHRVDASSASAATATTATTNSAEIFLVIAKGDATASTATGRTRLTDGSVREEFVRRHQRRLV